MAEKTFSNKEYTWKTIDTRSKVGLNRVAQLKSEGWVISSVRSTRTILLKISG